MPFRFHNDRRDERRASRAAKVLGALAATVLLVSANIACRAETLGEARQLSRVGEPLRLSIAVQPDSGPALDPTCVAVADPPRSDGLPHILTARVAVDRQPAGSTVLVTTAAAMREPALRLLLRTDCAGTTRAYTLFLEPPGSARVVRVAGQPGPRVDGVAAPRSAAGGLGTSPGVTVIPVKPETAARTPQSNLLQSGTGASLPDGPIPPPEVGAAAAAVSTNPATLEAENETLKQQLAKLNDELQRLQRNAAALQGAPPARNAPPPQSGLTAMAATSAVGEGVMSRNWDVGLSLAIALGGLAALVVGGLMWHRRHGQEWSLTGPPSHRVASRTSLAEEPVSFKPSGLNLEPEETHPAPTPQVERWPRQAPEHAPTSLLVQPSADDLGRELEEELEAAARAHSHLERSHPELIELLTRSWGTASARAQLVALLGPSSAELTRMSGEAVAELRLLQRIAEDLAQRPGSQPRSALLGPAAPVW